MGRILVLVLSLSLVAAVDGSRQKSATPAEQYKAHLKEFQDAAHLHFKATTDDERQKAVARVATLPLTILELVEKNAKEPFALEALVHVVTQEY